jgi:glycosyltransferase involved in cell wall biosynthesis
VLRLSVVIPTFNNLASLKACLLSVLANDLEGVEVLVCDNGSLDGTVEYMLDFCIAHPKVTFLQHPDKQNKGRAANRNQALGVAKGKYLVFLDSDTEASPHLLESHLQVLEQNSKAISLGKVEYTNRDNVWGQYLVTRGQGKYADKTVVPYQCFTTQNVAMRRQVFEQMGGFDPDFFFYGGDDTEFGFRLKKENQVEFVVNHGALATSEMDKDVDTALQQFREFGAINFKLIHQKHPDCSDVFLMRYFVQNDVKAKIFRILLNAHLASIVRKGLRLLPLPWRNVGLSYLVAFEMKRGFYGEV